MPPKVREASNVFGGSRPQTPNFTEILIFPCGQGKKTDAIPHSCDQERKWHCISFAYTLRIWYVIFGGNFMAKPAKPNQSCLIPHYNEIISLRSTVPPLSFTNIANILKNKYNVDVRRQTIEAFLKVRAKDRRCKIVLAIQEMENAVAIKTTEASIIATQAATDAKSAADILKAAADAKAAKIAAEASLKIIENEKKEKEAQEQKRQAEEQERQAEEKRKQAERQRQEIERKERERQRLLREERWRQEEATEEAAEAAEEAARKKREEEREEERKKSDYWQTPEGKELVNKFMNEAIEKGLKYNEAIKYGLEQKELHWKRLQGLQND